MSSTVPGQRPESIVELLVAMDARLDMLPPDQLSLRDFLGTYRRTTIAVDDALRDGFFEDPAWVEQWDLSFAGFYLDAVDAHSGRSDVRVPRPWRIAFDEAASQAPLLKVLLGVNAHINYDLPQSLLAVIPDAEFQSPEALARRRRDHERIDRILAGRVADEDGEISSRSSRTVLDRALAPLNRRASRRFLKEARVKVWNNTIQLWRAQRTGDNEYALRLGELEVLTAAKAMELLEPGPVLLRLAVAGFGVTLPPPGFGLQGDDDPAKGPRPE